MSSGFKILDASRPDENAAWLQAWSESEARDAFSHPEYCALYRDANTEACCASFQTAEGRVLFPFLLRRIGESQWRDITTPYGYGGAYVSGVKDSAVLMREFWVAFTAWEEQQSVVSEVVRCHVLDVCGEYAGARTEVSQNVICDLSVPEEAQWMQFEHKVRKNVKKATREGVTVEMDEVGSRLDRFLEIYHSTMSRRNAAGSYYYDRTFFGRIVEKMKGSYVFAHSIHQGQVVSTELVLVSANAIYSFLGGTMESAFAVCPNDALKHEVMRWARSKGLRYFILGGGYTPDDGIYRYKRAFAPEGVRSFFIGRRVLNQTVYDSLVAERREKTALGLASPPRDNFFPLYRG